MRAYRQAESEGEAWSEDERVSSTGSREGNVGNDALHVIGLYGPGDKISLFLQDLELARVALSCHIALQRSLCVTARQAFLSPWTGCDKNGKGCGERMKEKER